MFQLIVEFVLFVAFATIIVTQIMLPIIRNRPMFPLFRHRDLVEEITELHDVMDRKDMEKERDKLRRKVAPTNGGEAK